jgi:mono/diheme cytochrome c family protein
MKKVLKVTGIGIVAIILVICLVAVWSMARWNAPTSRKAKEMKAPSDAATLARGKFLYTYGHGCVGCHGGNHDVSTAPKGGVVFDLNTFDPKLGMFYSRNITPDTETGIGSWTDGEIVRALREGIRKDGTTLFPIMPMESLHGLSDEDALALVAYLRTLPPVRNPVPDRVPTFFTKVLMTLGVIGPMPEIEKPIAAPRRDPPALYGRYLANHAALCVDCHTPRNLADGSFYKDSLFAGSSFAFGGPEGDPTAVHAANITPDMATGIGVWTEEAFLKFMHTGMGPEGVVRDGHMPYAETSRWQDEDLKALWAYLRTVRPVQRPEVPRIFQGAGLSQDPATLGKGMYATYCTDCHGTRGRDGLNADLSLAEVAPTLSDTELETVIRQGMEGTHMPGFDKTLDDAQLKALITHVRTLGGQ